MEKQCLVLKTHIKIQDTAPLLAQSVLLEDLVRLDRPYVKSAQQVESSLLLKFVKSAKLVNTQVQWISNARRVLKVDTTRKWVRAFVSDAQLGGLITTTQKVLIVICVQLGHPLRMPWAASSVQIVVKGVIIVKLDKASAQIVQQAGSRTRRGLLRPRSVKHVTLGTIRTHQAILDARVVQQGVIRL